MKKSILIAALPVAAMLTPPGVVYAFNAANIKYQLGVGAGYIVSKVIPRSTDDQLSPAQYNSVLVPILHARARYYLPHYFIGLTLSNIPTTYYLFHHCLDCILNAPSNTQYLKADWLFDYGIQFGFPVFSNMDFVASILTATGRFNLQDSRDVTSVYATGSAVLQGWGFGAGLEQHLAQHIVLSENYKYLAFPKISITKIIPASANGSSLTISQARPTEDMLDLALSVEFA